MPRNQIHRLPLRASHRSMIRCRGSAHKDATSLFERYAKDGDDAKLKDWAGKTLPAPQHHLQMAEDMNKNGK